MRDRRGGVAATVQEGSTGFTKPAPRRVPIGDERGTSAQPQLLVLAASLLLWTLIITTATVVFK